MRDAGRSLSNRKRSSARLQWWRSLPVWFLAGTVSAVPLSDDESDKLRRGVAAMESGDFAGALALFEAAAADDPTSGEPLFFEGAALNRLGRPAEALERLIQAEELGASHPDLAFESGWALLGLGRWAPAIEQLEWYENAHPGRAQTVEFLGRAYYHTGDLDRAESLLTEAMRRDPRLEPTVRAYLALVSAERGRALESAQQVAKIAEKLGTSPLGREIRRYLVQMSEPPLGVPPPGARRWRLSVSAGAGWNSNVIGIGNGIPLPPEISDESSAFARFTAQGSYDVLRGTKDLLRGGGSFQADIYENELDDANLVDFYGFLDYRHAFSKDCAATIRVSDEYTFIGGDSFRNRIGLRPTIAWRACPSIIVEAFYVLTTNNYMYTSSPPQDRDGNSNSFGVNANMSIPGTSWIGTVGALYTDYAAEGSDFDFDGLSLWVSVSHPLPLGVYGEVLYTHVWERYDNPNSLSPTGARRRDGIDLVTLQLTRPIWERDGRRARLYLRFDFTNDDSNVPAYSYDQFAIGGGIIIDF